MMDSVHQSKLDWIAFYLDVVASGDEETRAQIDAMVNDCRTHETQESSATPKPQGRPRKEVERG